VLKYVPEFIYQTPCDSRFTAAVKFIKAFFAESVKDVVPSSNVSGLVVCIVNGLMPKLSSPSLIMIVRPIIEAALGNETVPGAALVSKNRIPVVKPGVNAIYN